MTPKPYSDKSSLPTDSSNDIATGMPTEILPQTPSPETLSGASTPSPTPQEQVPVETFVDIVNIQENNRISDLGAVTPCYPTPGDIMPYDHSLPDFIRQITNQPNLANLQSLSLRVISTLISLHRMSAYLPNLRELDLEGSVLNSLRDIGCSLKNLQILKVGRCQLESLDGTFGLSSLRELYAQKNFINDVSPCSNLPHIRHIDVSGNRIRNISYAGFLSVCRKLKSIVFTGNPATEVPGYRNHVRRILPQVETLDGVPFVNEGVVDIMAEQELLENYEEGSDSSSDVADFSSVSPRDVRNNALRSEDLFLLDKKNKQAKNLANQDQSDAADGGTQELENEAKTDFQFQDEFQMLNSYQNPVRKGYVGQGKNMDNRSASLKQKCTSIQKLDKDIENRSKKSNLILNSSLDEEFISSQEFSKCHLQEGGHAGSPSTSDSAIKSDNPIRFSTSDQGSTATPETLSKNAEEIKRRVINITSCSSLDKKRDEEQTMDQNWTVNKLTSGLPICGNLTAALRNRKRNQNSWAEKEHIFQRNSRSSRDADDETRMEAPAHGFGDNIDAESDAANEDDMIGEDVLATSRKWRESFRRFRSNNRASWEEEESEDEKEEFTSNNRNLNRAENKMQ